MALKQDGVNFVLCPKQGNKIKGFSQTGYVFKEFSCRNRVRVSNRQQLTSTQILVGWSSTPPPPPAQLCSKKSRRNHHSCVWREALSGIRESAKALMVWTYPTKIHEYCIWSSILLSEVLNNDPWDIDTQWRIQRWRPHSVTLQN